MKQRAWVLGVDPGLRNTGWAVVTPTGQCLGRGTIVVPDTTATYLHARYIIRALEAVLNKWSPPFVIVESVTWQGKARSGMLALSQLVGELRTYLSLKGKLVGLVRPSDKKRPSGKGKGAGGGWDDHQRDAVALGRHGLLALMGKTNVPVDFVISPLWPPLASQASTRTTTARKNTPTTDTNGESEDSGEILASS